MLSESAFSSSLIRTFIYKSLNSGKYRKQFKNLVKMIRNSVEKLKIFTSGPHCNYVVCYNIPSDSCLFFAKIRMKKNLLSFCFLLLSLKMSAQYGGNAMISYPEKTFDSHYLFSDST